MGQKSVINCNQHKSMGQKSFLIIALLCAMAQGAWAEAVNYIYYTENADGKTVT